MSLYGCDVSSNNTNYKTIIDNNNAFVIIKATEGRTYVNPMMSDQTAYAIQRGKLIGFYHYARPENGNTYKQEADNFIKAVKPYLGQAVLVLDYEDKAHGVGANWARNFVRYIYQKTGVMPMFYTSAAYLKKYTSVAALDAGLWVAAYGRKTRPDIAPWKLCAMWQYRCSPYDRSIFYGNAAAWRKYAQGNK